MGKRPVIALLAMLSLGVFPGASAYAKKNPPRADQSFQQPIPKDERVLQALNRLTFGPAPGDLERFKAMRLKKWIDLQLHPDRIPENPVLAEKLKMLDSLSTTSQQLVQNYPQPQMVRQMVNGALPFPDDPDRRMMIQKLVDRFERRQKQGA